VVGIAAAERSAIRRGPGRDLPWLIAIVVSFSVV